MKINDLFNINNKLINDFIKLIKSLLIKERLLTNNINFDIIIN